MILERCKASIFRFNKDTVKRVVEELQASEGGEIPTEINGESLEEPTYITWTVHTPRRTRQVMPDPNQVTMFDGSGRITSLIAQANTSSTIGVEEGSKPSNFGGSGNSAPEYIPPRTVTVPVLSGTQQADPAISAEEIPEGKQLELMPELDRVEIIDFINEKGYLTYFVRQG